MIIAEHTNERNTVLDPFCGCGTTLVEAALMGRKSVGVDSNPIATLSARAKTHPLSSTDSAKARELLARVTSTHPDDIPAQEPSASDFQNHWFQGNMSRELAWLREMCASQPGSALRDFLLCVFSSIIVATSNQDGETRYKAVDKDLADGYALSRFSRKLVDALEWTEDLSHIDRLVRNPPAVHTTDTTRIRNLLDPNTIDLIVTSPPYPNSYDYYLYHKLRMWWLGFDHRSIQKTEIGSRYEHSSQKAPLEVFLNRIRPAMAGLARALKPSKLGYFFVGDSIISGEHIDMAETYRQLAEDTGFRFVDSTSYELGAVSRSFQATRGVAGTRRGTRKLQHVLVFEGRETRRKVSSRAIAKPASSEPIVSLEEVETGSTVALASDESDRHVHSLAPYPSKFIPDIPRWAIEKFSQSGDVVLDPFAGSGTTAVEALLLGRSAVSVDLSPYAILASKAKTTRVSESVLKASAELLEGAAEEVSSLPPAERPAFPLDDFWFATSHLAEFARLLRFVDEGLPDEVNPFFRLLLASTIRSFSYQDPGQIKVKRDPRKVMRGTPSPSELLLARLPVAVDRLNRFSALDPEQSVHTAHQGSADDFLGSWPSGGADLIVTSPPYINAMNYPMIQRYELLLLGLIEPEELNSHQADYFGTERVYARDYATLHQFPTDHPLAASLNTPLRSIFEKEPKRSYIAFRFFEQMFDTCGKMVQGTQSGGRIVLVAGTNVIRGVPIDTFNLLVRSCEAFGATTELSFHYEILKQAFKLRRHTTSSLIPHDGVAVLRVA